MEKKNKDAHDDLLRALEKRTAARQIDRRGFLRLTAAMGVQASLAAFMADRALASPVPQANAGPASSYDYIVVGAGSAGSVVANRLSAGGKARVLLIEAGGSDVDRSTLTSPFIWPANFKTDVDWGYRTVPQANAENRVFDWPRGKVIGGSSSINAMIWAWGHQADFDEWAYAGNAGWSFGQLKELFQAVERCTRENASAQRGSIGPMHVGSMKTPNPMTASFLEACRQTGHTVLPDVNGPVVEGAGYMDLSIKDDKRFSVVHGYLLPALTRENLTLVTSAIVEKLLFEGERCIGVRLRMNGESRDIRAERETIVSAGAIESPRLLMVSGIGAAEELRRLGIKQVVNLPGVGENLQDHLMVDAFVAETREKIPPGFRFDGHMFYRTSANAYVPDMQVLFIPAALGTAQLKRNEGFTLRAGLVRPQSRGRIRLTSQQPGSRLLIDPVYLGARADLDALVAAVAHCREIGMAEGLSAYRKRDIGFAPAGKAAIADFVKRNVDSYWHPVGTCAMGIHERAVVNPQLQVYGVSGLRVADASIMPTITSANTNAPTIVIGEKAARMILAA
jgi:choline dehydrogenase